MAVRVTPDARNANKGTQRGRGLLEKSLRQYGAGRSVLTDKHGTLIAGNKTHEIAAEIGLPVRIIDTDGHELVVVRRTDLDLTTDKAAVELGIADNRVGEVSLDWDTEVLAELTQEIDLTAFWHDDELAALLGNAKPVADDPGAQVDRADELRQKWQTERGQLWQVGRHRLLCGDSTNADDVARLLDGATPELMVTDPPYGVDYVGGHNQDKRPAITGDRDTSLYHRALSVWVDVMSDKAPVYLWFAGSLGRQVYEAVDDVGLTVRSLLIWNKVNAHYGDFMAQYMERKEPCLYCVGHQGADWFGPTNEVTVWDIEQPSVNEFHPTQKPVECMARPIRNSSPAGAVVADPFLGSGTTAVAAEQTDRICYGMEIEPKYVAVALERLAGMGLDARRLD